ncbi:MAG: hypothetical protein ACREL7_07220 [Longimicrobiales bacterium]
MRTTDEIVLDIPAPSWLLLFWCGLAAALASEFVAAALRPPRLGRRRGETNSPRLQTGPRENTFIALLLAALLFTPVYGLIFEVAHRADAPFGAILGAAHGLVAGAFALLSAAHRADDVAATPIRALAWFRIRRLISHTTFGAVLGFLYAVPGFQS